MYILVRDKVHNQQRLKGKNVSEFTKNLESEGWPSEFYNEEHRDRVKFQEKKKGYRLRRNNLEEISTAMGIPTQEKVIEEVAEREGCIKKDGVV